MRTDPYFKASMDGYIKEKEHRDVSKLSLRYNPTQVSKFIIFNSCFYIKLELKNIVPYSKTEDSCFMCKEKLKIERDQCISNGFNQDL